MSAATWWYVWHYRTRSGAEARRACNTLREVRDVAEVLFRRRREAHCYRHPGTAEPDNCVAAVERRPHDDRRRRWTWWSE